MGLFSWLKGSSESKSEPGAMREYNGYSIQATLLSEGNQFRICGRISKDGQEKTFIRSDLVADKETAEQITLNKAEMIINQRGEALFSASQI